MVLGVVIAAELWWTYFAWVHAAIERTVDAVTGSVQSTMARDAFSFVHFVVGRRARCSCRSPARRSAKPGAPRPRNGIGPRGDADLPVHAAGGVPGTHPARLATVVNHRRVLDGRNALKPEEWRAAGWTCRTLGRR